MRKLFEKLLQDETGAIVTAELVIIATVVVLASVVGWNAVAGAMVGELVDIASAFGSLDQSYNYNGISHRGHATCSGSGFNDFGNNLVLGTNSQTVRGGGGGTSGGSFGGGASIAGGGGFSGGSSAAAPSASGFAAAPEQPSSFIDTFTAVESETVAAIEQQQAVGLLVEAEEVAVTCPTEKCTEAIQSSDECERLRRKVEELCKELHQIKKAEAAATKSLKPIPESRAK